MYKCSRIGFVSHDMGMQVALWCMVRGMDWVCFYASERGDAANVCVKWRKFRFGREILSCATHDSLTIYVSKRRIK